MASRRFNLILRRGLVAWVCAVLALIGCHRSLPPARATGIAVVPPSWRFHLDAPPTVAAHAMVLSESALATHAGAQLLDAGGNAVDAAVATALALAVVYPEAGNLGGGGFAVVRDAAGQSYALDFRETAPGAATRNMYIGSDDKVTDASRIGPLAAGVPGTVAGLFSLHKKLGKRPWAEVVAPAILLADEGFAVDAHFAAGVHDLSERLARFPAAAALFLPGGQPPVVGSTFRNPELAAVLRRLATGGPDDFYRGTTADLIADEMKRSGGIITKADLAAYMPKWRPPMEFDYRGHHVISMPLPSSGGFALYMIARLLGGYDLHGFGWHSALHLHLLAEAERRAFADRNDYLGDPDVTPMPPRLLDPAYAEKRRETIVLDRATPSAQVAHGLGLDPSSNTTHLAVVDGEGAAVALTFTLNELYGGGVVVGGAGFLLNDEMDDFAAAPGVPNAFGLVQGEVNAIAPGKRPLSSMAPTIVLDEHGQVLLVAGARGGSRIISATFQVISNVVDFGMDVGPAVAAPRIHQQDQPDLLYLEPDGFGDDVMTHLASMGHPLKPIRGVGNGGAILRVNGAWRALCDPREGGGAEGR